MECHSKIRIIYGIIAALNLLVDVGPSVSTHNPVSFVSVPQNATVKVDESIWFICNFDSSVILNMMLIFVTSSDNFTVNVNFTSGVGIHLLLGVSLQLNSTNVSCIITDNDGSVLISDCITMVVQDPGTSNDTGTSNTTTSSEIVMDNSSTPVSPTSRTNSTSGGNFTTPNFPGVGKSKVSTELPSEDGDDDHRTVGIVVGVVVGILVIMIVLAGIVILICYRNVCSSIKSICCCLKVSVAFGRDNGVATKMEKIDTDQVGTVKFATGNEENGKDRNTRTVTSRRRTILPRNESSVSFSRNTDHVSVRIPQATSEVAAKYAEGTDAGYAPRCIMADEGTVLSIIEQTVGNHGWKKSDESQTEQPIQVEIPSTALGGAMVHNVEVHLEPIAEVAEGSDAGDEFRDDKSDRKDSDRSIVEQPNGSNVKQSGGDELVMVVHEPLVYLSTREEERTTELPVTDFQDDIGSSPENPPYIFPYCFN